MARLHIAVTHPTCWPWVRRGSERLLNDLGQVMAARGHDVTVLSSSPEGTGSRQDGPVKVLFAPQRLRWLGGRRQLNGFHAFAFDCRRMLAGGRFDVAHCLNYHDAWGALAARRASGSPARVIYQMTGIPVRRYFRSVPVDRWMFDRVVSEADEVLVLSRFAAERLQDEFGRKGIVLPSPTVAAPFAAIPRVMAEPPRILFVGDVDEPRKGAHLLPPALIRLRDAGLPVTLHFSGRCTPGRERALRSMVPDALQAALVFHGVGRVEELPRLYASAAVVVNPAIWEALGNVLTEALAAGVPVVGCAHGGIPDIIDSDRVGALFEPGPMGASASNVDGLCTALHHALALAGLPETEAHCRARARAFAWETLAPRYEALLAGSGA